MAYRKKAHLLLKEKPDLVVIPECEHPDKIRSHPGIPLHNDCTWFGTNPHKGLGVFSYGPCRLQLLEVHNPDFRTILPIHVTGGKTDFILFAVWANNPLDKKFEYIGQVWKALHFYSRLVNMENTLWVGDFNSNTIWDKPKREGNHTTVVKFLEERNIHSVYHKFHNQEQGKEKHNTLFMYRHKDKPYHIDYCFASSGLVNKLQSVKIGTHRKWARHSDHTPLIVSFDL
jgi:exonuclease III